MNPIFEMQAKAETEETKPLLERIKEVESNMEEEGRVVRAKVECVETKVNEDTRLLRSQMSTLEEDNSAFKARLETLESKAA